jgi:AcrR family transcriptional regulator
MENKGTIKNKSQKERLVFYAEIGNYFSPDGQFDENAFRMMLREVLGNIKQAGDNSFPEKLSGWMSSYLAEATFRLVRAAIEEAEHFGLSNLSIPAEQMKHLLEKVPSPPKKEERKKSSSDEMRRKIFEAAVEVFGSKGYHRATIDDIVALSGVGKGSVYRYFKSKEDLLSELLVEKYNEFVDIMNRLFSRDMDILQQIHEMIKKWLEFIETNHVVYRLIQVEANAKNISGSNMFYDYVINHLPMLKERIISLNREKQLKTTNFYTVFYGILGFVDGVVQKWYRLNMSYPLRDELPVILEVIFNGFVGETKTGKHFYIPPGGKV